MGTVFVGWDPARTADSFRRLRGLMAGRGLGGASVIVCNKPELATIVTGLGTDVIVGTNSTAEFSGYDEGIAHVIGKHGAPDVWVIANDRIDSYSDEHARYITPALLRLLHNQDLVAGRIDRLPERACLLDQGVQYYVRSNLILMSERLRSKVGDLCRLPTSEAGAVIGRETYDEAVLDEFRERFPGYSDFILDWLTGSGDGRFGRWYRASPVSGKNWREMRSKMISIFNEHLLGARCEAIGAEAISSHQAALVAALWEENNGAKSEVGRALRDQWTTWRFREDQAAQRRLALRVLLARANSRFGGVR